MKSVEKDKNKRHSNQQEEDINEEKKALKTSLGDDEESISSSESDRSSKEMTLEDGVSLISSPEEMTFEDNGRKPTFEDDGRNPSFEDDGRRPTTSESSRANSSQTDYNIELMLSNCVVAWRFIIAIFLWVCQFIPPPGDYHVNAFSWYHVIFGLPTAFILVLWKVTEVVELFYQFKDTEEADLRCRAPRLILPLLSLIGSLTYLAGSVCARTGTDAQIVVVLWLFGWGVLVLTNVLEAIVATCRTSLTFCKEGILNGVLRIVAHILQALAFASFTPRFGLSMFNLNIAWSGLFYILDGILVCTLNGSNVLPFWNVCFKALTAFSFWATSVNFEWYGSRWQEEVLIPPSLNFEPSEQLEWIMSFLIPGGRVENIPIQVNYILPIMFLLTSLLFDTQKMLPQCTFIISVLPVAFLSSFYIDQAANGVMITSVFLLLWALFSWVRVCWVRAGKIGVLQGIKATLQVLWSVIKLPWTLIARCIQDNELARNNSQISMIDLGELENKPYGQAFHLIACILLVTQNFMVREDAPEYLPIMLVSIVTGIFYLMYSICCFKTEYSSGITDKNVDLKYILSEDTYTLMMYTKIFSKTWLIGLAVFFLQATLIGMILAAQFSQYRTSTHFLNVPFDVPFSTRIGQVAGMILVIVFQNDYWVASTMLEIRFLGRKKSVRGLKINEMEENVSLTRNLEGDVESVNPSGKFRQKLSVFFPSVIRLFQCIGVIVASTVLIIQSDNIIDLVKDYTAIFFISEIDDFVYNLAAQGYIGDASKKSAKTAKGTCVSDVKEHPFRMFGFVTMFSITISCWIYVTMNQSNGKFFRLSHAACYDKVGWMKLDAVKFGDGNCNLDLNFEECGFDDGDCLVENIIHERNITQSTKYENCTVAWKTYIGNGRCDGQDYNTDGCLFDGDDCTEFNDLYPNCTASNPFRVGDGICDKDGNNTGCGFDGGDCNFTFGLM